MYEIRERRVCTNMETNIIGFPISTLLWMISSVYVSIGIIVKPNQTLPVGSYAGFDAALVNDRISLKVLQKVNSTLLHGICSSLN